MRQVFLPITSAALKLKDTEERIGEKVEEKKWRKVPADFTCSMSQLYPTFWLRLEIHQSASNAASAARMKESLEAAAKGRQTRVRSLLSGCSHAWAREGERRKEETPPRRLSVCVCVPVRMFVCAFAHYCLLGQSGLIRF